MEIAKDLKTQNTGKAQGCVCCVIRANVMIAISIDIYGQFIFIFIFIHFLICDIDPKNKQRKGIRNLSKNIVTQCLLSS